ncbi:protein CBFA2T3 isoform X2 [Pseudomyrmex gracilis]|nr:protein CBFA2T3 isoform X2 [Pseudomyrmex gracilis]
MKVEGGVATTTVLHKVKVKEETKECCGYQQASPSSTSAAATSTVATLTVSTAIATTVTNSSNGVSAVGVISSTTTTVSTVAPALQSSSSSSSIICHPPTTISNTDTFPVDLDLKAKNKAPTSSSSSSALREKSSREETAQPEAHSPSSQHQRIVQQKQTNGSRSEYKGASRSSDNDSPLPSQSLKPELEDGSANAGSCRTDEQCDGATPTANGSGASRCVSGIFAGHGKLKRLLGTLVQFATDISADTGDTVRTLVLTLLSGSMTAEEFHSALQEATNFPLRGFVLPYLKHTLPSLQRDLSNAARANNQSCAQFLRSNESAVLEAVGLVPSGESVEVFGEHGGANGIAGGNQCSAHYAMRSNSNPGVGAIQHAAGSNTAGALHHYPGAAHAPKRRASDTPYYENGALLDDMPVYGKRSTNPWSHHHQQQQQQQQQQQPTDPSYCWYHPLHSSSGSIQGHAHGHGHGPSPLPPSLVQINQINAFSTPHHLAQQPQQPMSHGLQIQNGGSLDDEWKNIHVMLNCILGMVEKTKRALAILQRRGCSSPAAAAPPPGMVAAQNGTSNNANGNNPSSTNGAQVESSTNDRDGSLKRLSGEIVAQTIKATEDKVAEVKRRAEEAVLEVKRAAVAEVQRAVAVAVAESRASERLRVHRLLDLPMSQRNHSSLRQSSFLRVHGSSSAVEARTTPTTTSNSAPSTTEDEKDIHLTSVMGSSCWNCGRPALETCGGCGIARYCGSFCQHRDWEAGHHTTCNNLPPREPRRSASRSPPRITTDPRNLSASVNEVDATPVPSVGVSKGK